MAFARNTTTRTSRPIVPGDTGGSVCSKRSSKYLARTSSVISADPVQDVR